jgi:O-methyltransferase
LALKEVSVAAKIFLVDTFKGVVKPGINDPVYKGGEHADTSMKTVVDLIAKTSLQNVEVFEGIYPETVVLPASIKFRLCHIDVDTYQSAKDIFIHVWPFVNKGGCVVFDDYGFWGCEGVTTLCNELTLSDAVFFYNLNGHAIFVKV